MASGSISNIVFDFFGELLVDEIFVEPGLFVLMVVDSIILLLVASIAFPFSGFIDNFVIDCVGVLLDVELIVSADVLLVVVIVVLVGILFVADLVDFVGVLLVVELVVSVGVMLVV